MSGEKVKVFTLAKRYGYKSSEFVNIMRDIGFPVSSYQASIDAWDVPVIEERLLKGGLIQSSQATSIEEIEPQEQQSDTPSWTEVMKAATAAEEAASASTLEPAVEEEQSEPQEDQKQEEPSEEISAALTSEEPLAPEEVAEAPAPPAEIVAVEAPEDPQPEPEPEPVPVEEPVEAAAPEQEAAEPIAPVEETEPALTQAQATETETTPAPEAPAPDAVSEDEETPPPQPVEAPPMEVAASAAETSSPSENMPTGVQAETAKAEVTAETAAVGSANTVAEKAKSSTQPKAAALKTEGSAKQPQGKGKGKKGKDKSATPPKPRPRAGAKKVGMIDLAALGLVKAKQAKEKKNVTLTDIRDRETGRRRDQRTRQRERQKQRRAGQLGPKEVSTVERKREVVLEQPVSVKSFSVATGIAINQILGQLMRMGTMANVNSSLDDDSVVLLADELNIKIRLKQAEDVEESLMEEIEAARKAVDDSQLEERPVVIAFMGHVDHGKTSLIDAIRNTKVAHGEAGGITQHVGSYQATLNDGRKVTILDTPGHEAFTAMRARGAQTTDIAVLVIAADDGVMPQTEEAANHAKAAGVPIVVAINKMDAPGANADKVRAELAGLGLQDENWGGSTGMVEVSALKKQGMNDLLERVLLESEILELKAHKEGEALGVVLESKVSEGQGKVADVLVQDGSLAVGQVVLAGQAFGKIRRILDHNGKAIKKAGPSSPITILGLNDLPEAGERFYVVRDMSAAKDVAEKRLQLRSEADRAEKSKIRLDNIFDRMQEDSLERISVVLKVDVQGSLEVLRKTLPELSHEEVRVELVHSAVGSITESDVILAETADAIVIGFNVGPDPKAKRAAEKAGVDIRRYNVIYELTEHLEAAIEGKLAPDMVEEQRGRIEVLQVFRSSRYGSIAGCTVLEGEVHRSYFIRVLRDGKQMHEGGIESLRRMKDDVREVKAGNECGIKVAGYDNVREGDILEVFERVERARVIEVETAGKES